MARKNVSRRVCEGRQQGEEVGREGGHVSAFTPQLISGAVPFYPRMQGDPAGSCASGNTFGKAKKYSWEGKSLDAMKN